jgi:hypothetical protein
MGHVKRIGERGGAYRVVVGKQQGWRPLGRPRRKWKNSIKTDFIEKDRGMNWIDVAEGWDKWQPFVKAAMNPRFT